MKRTLSLLLLPLLAGCLTSSAPTVTRWPVEYAGTTRDGEPKHGVTRVAQVVVRAPYNAEDIVVFRKDGSVAFDPYNAYAALPSSLLKGVLFDAMNASGLFKAVVGASSAAKAGTSVELTVTRLGLDCRTEGERKAVAAVSVRILEGRDVGQLAKGEGEADAADGNYGRAFSQAMSAALTEALGKIR